MHAVQSQVSRNRMKLIFCISCILFIVSDRSVEQTPDTHTICLVSEEYGGAVWTFCVGVVREKLFFCKPLLCSCFSG